MLPEISVVIVTYNRPAKLSRLLQMLGEQTLVPEIFVMDDGSTIENLPAMLPPGVHHSRRDDDGYHRVERINTGMQLVRSPYAIILDDDQMPQSRGFVLSYLRSLDRHAIVRGLGINEQGVADVTGWWSTANIGVRLDTWRILGGLDPAYDGRYGDEDLDFGKQVERLLTPWAWGGPDTACLHTGLPFAGDRSGYEINHAYYQRKWGNP